MKNKKIYCLIFFSLFVLGWLFPYTGDDWTWGSRVGLERLSKWFDNYSGRYWGNLMVLALTRSNVLKALAVSVGVGGIIYMLDKLTGKQPYGIPVILCALIFMPTNLFRQSIAWTSGFANYTTSVFFTLIYVCYVNGMYKEAPTSKSYLHAILLAVLGFGNTLIVEHVTIYNIVLAVYVPVFVFVKYHKICIQHVAYLLGCICGTMLMFSNSCYSSTLSGDDFYRSTALGSGILPLISRAFTNLFDKILNEGLFYNVAMLLIVAAVCVFVYAELHHAVKKKYKRINNLSFIAIVAYGAFALFLELSGVKQTSFILLLKLGATVVYALALISFVLSLPVDKMKKVKLLFILGSVVMLLAPLLVVTPINSRCFFAAYVWMILFALELCTLLHQDTAKEIEIIKPLLYTFACVGFTFLFYIYTTIHFANEERVNTAIQNAQISKEITVEHHPYSEYTWLSNLNVLDMSTRFKIYFDIDEDVIINTVNYDSTESLADKIVKKLK